MQNDSNSLQELTNLIRSGRISSKDLIKHVEEEVKAGNTEPSILTYLVKYLTLVDRLTKLGENEYVNMQELIDLGIYDSIDEIQTVIHENPDDFKDSVFKTRPCPYPEPTTEEINQNIDIDDTDRNCIICCTRLKNTIFIPCGHSLCCTVCSKTLAKQARTEDVQVDCLVCKKRVDSINKVYL